jgi:hypothetical protein
MRRAGIDNAQGDLYTHAGLRRSNRWTQASIVHTSDFACHFDWWGARYSWLSRLTMMEYASWLVSM